MFGNKTIDVRKVWIGIFLCVFAFVPFLLFDINIIWFIITIIIIIVSISCGLSGQNKYYPYIIFLGALIIRLIALAMIETIPESDFEYQIYAAQKLLEGDWSFVNEIYYEIKYFEIWPYHLGIVSFQSMLLGIWNDIHIIQVVNCVANAGTALLIYKISKEVVSEQSAKLVSLLYCIFPFSVTYVTVLSNQHMATFLTAFAIYFVVSKDIKCNDYLKYAVFSGILVFADVLRPESIIPIFAMVLYLLLTMNKTNMKSQMLKGLVMILIYIIFKEIISGCYVLIGLSEKGLINTNTFWKFAVGLNSESIGQWNYSDFLLAGDKEACISLIIERVTAPVSTLFSLFMEKIKITWLGGALWWPLHYSIDNNLEIFGMNSLVIYEVLTKVNNAISWIMYILLCLGAIRMFKEKNINKKYVLLMNYVFVSMGVFLLIEVQTRYIHNVQVYVFILAGLGIDAIREFLSLKVLKRWSFNEKN